MLEEKITVKVNVPESLIMVVSPNGWYGVDVVLNKERKEQVDCFRYLEVDVHKPE